MATINNKIYCYNKYSCYKLRAQNILRWYINHAPFTLFQILE